MAAPIPENEDARLAALEAYSILDTQAEQDYDDITNVAACLCGSPIAIISLVDESRQWFKSRVGLDADQTPREYAFCAHAILEPGELMVVNDAANDERFADNPLVTGSTNIRLYAGAPLIARGGHALGTICVIDREPRDLTPPQAEGLRALSRLVTGQLETRRAIAEMEDKILQQEDYLADADDYQRRMEESELHHDRAPLAGVVRELESQPAIDQLLGRAQIRRNNRFRQAIGVLVRMIMERRGWKKTGRKGSLGVRAKGVSGKPAHNTGGLALWFIRAERYELAEGMPFQSVRERSTDVAASPPQNATAAT